MYCIYLNGRKWEYKNIVCYRQIFVLIICKKIYEFAWYIFTRCIEFQAIFVLFRSSRQLAWASVCVSGE